MLVHSFPTNSVLLHGLEEFFADFFTVHFIDLPGFHKNNPKHKGSVTLKKFSNYFDQQIAELDADEYIVGGISFGFLVFNFFNLKFYIFALGESISTYYRSLCMFPHQSLLAPAAPIYR